MRAAFAERGPAVSAGQLLASLEIRSSASLMIRHLSHLLAAAGIGLGALWIALSRRRWRWAGLEVRALLLAAAALLAVPVASDKRLEPWSTPRFSFW